MNDPLDPHRQREVAVTARTSVPPVRNYLRGLKVRSTTRARIEEALRALGLAHLIRTDGTTP